jgi:hypothetical protein
MLKTKENQTFLVATKARRRLLAPIGREYFSKAIKRSFG